MTAKSATPTVEKACRYCEQPLSKCPDPFTHDRLHGSSEWTWIRTARQSEAVTR